MTAGAWLSGAMVSRSTRGEEGRGEAGRDLRVDGDFRGEDGPAPGLEGSSGSSTLRSFFGRIIRRLIAAAPGGRPSSSSVGLLPDSFSTLGRSET